MITQTIIVVLKSVFFFYIGFEMLYFLVKIDLWLSDKKSLIHHCITWSRCTLVDAHSFV